MAPAISRRRTAVTETTVLGSFAPTPTSADPLNDLRLDARGRPLRAQPFFFFDLRHGNLCPVSQIMFGVKKMSDEFGNYRRRRQKKKPNYLNPKCIPFKSDGYQVFVLRHEFQINVIWRKKNVDHRDFAEQLFYRASHENTLRIALEDIVDSGGKSPGPDGEDMDSYREILEEDNWAYLRDVRDWIRNNEYETQRGRIVKIPKANGRDMRQIEVMNIEDRMIHRAANLIISPWLEPFFLNSSFAYRKKRSIFDALALVSQLYRSSGFKIWVTADIRNAFQSVPLRRLEQILLKYLQNEEICEYIKVLLVNSPLKGLRQGSPISGLLLNLYLHHFLDIKWANKFPETPLIRYADDILLLCATKQEARKARKNLEDMLRPTGMILKGSCEQDISRVLKTKPVDWLGFNIYGDGKRLSFDFSERSWWQLEDKLTTAIREEWSEKEIQELFRGWVAHYGPAFSEQNIKLYDKKMKLLEKKLGRSLPTGEQMSLKWKAGNIRWMKKLDSRRKKFELAWSLPMSNRRPKKMMDIN